MVARRFPGSLKCPFPLQTDQAVHTARDGKKMVPRREKSREGQLHQLPLRLSRPLVPEVVSYGDPRVFLELQPAPLGREMRPPG